MSHVRTFILAGLLACSASLAQADDGPQTSISIENQDFILAGKVEPDINGTIVRPVYGPLGAYCFFYVDGSNAEAIVGPMYTPRKWLVIGTGVGVEQTSGTWRAGGMLWLGDDRYASSTFIETGASGFWAKEEFVWKPRGWIGLGALGDTSVGYGPRAEIDLPHTPFQLWGAMLYAKDGDGVVPAFGFRLNI